MNHTKSQINRVPSVQEHLSRKHLCVCLVVLQEKDKPNSTTMNGSPGSAGMGEQMGVKIEPAEAESLSVSGSSGILTPVSPYACVKPPTPTPISPEQDELINRLVSFQCEFEQPSEEDLKRITVCIMYPFCICFYLLVHIVECLFSKGEQHVEVEERIVFFGFLLKTVYSSNAFVYGLKGLAYLHFLIL